MTAPKPLDVLAVEIRAAYKGFADAQMTALERVKQTGELLIEAKAQFTKHGEWTDWVETNCPFTERMAQNYSRIARHWPELMARAEIENRNGVSDLSLRQAL